MRSTVIFRCAVLFLLALVFLGPAFGGGSTPTPTTCSGGGFTDSSIGSNFNGTAISAGYIWFNSNFSASGAQNGTVIQLQNSFVQFSAGGTSYKLPVPNAQITFSSAASCAKTSFDTTSKTWLTVVPVGGSDEIFLSGLTFPIPAGGLPGGINPVIWSGKFQSTTAGVSIKWKWGAAVYGAFTTNYNDLAVKPTHSSACGYDASDHAGTPEASAYKKAVLGGARGGGGANYTGSWSGTTEIALEVGCILTPPPPPPTVVLHKTASPATVLPGGKINYTITVTNSGGSDISGSLLITDLLAATTQIDGINKISCDKGSNYSWSTAPLTFQLTSLKAGETATIPFTVKVAKDAACGQHITNTARIDSLNLTSETTDVLVDCAPPKLEIHKCASPASVDVGGSISYTITLQNTGGQAITTPITVSDPLPASVQMQAVDGVSCSAGSNYGWNWPDSTKGNIVTFSVASLQIGETVTMKFKVKVLDAASCAKINNQASATFGSQPAVLSEQTTVMAACKQYRCSGSVDLGIDPVGVAVNSTTHEAVITTGVANQVVFMNLLTTPPSVTGTLTLDNPYGVAVNPVTNRAVVTNTGSSRITIIDLATHAVAGQVTVGLSPRGVVVNPKTNTAVVANFGWDSVSIVDLTAGVVTAILPVGQGPDSVAIDPGTNLAAVGNTLSNNVSVVDLAAYQVQNLAGFNTPSGTAFNASSGLLYVVNQGTALLSQVQTKPPTLMGNITAAAPGVVLDQVAVNSSLGRAVIGDFSDSTLIFIDLATGAQLMSVDLTTSGGIGPRGLAIDEALGLVVVVHQSTNVVVFVTM